MEDLHLITQSLRNVLYKTRAIHINSFYSCTIFRNEVIETCVDFYIFAKELIRGDNFFSQECTVFLKRYEK